jgi:proteasome-associated ATPase
MSTKGFRGPFDDGGMFGSMRPQMQPMNELDVLRMKCRTLEEMFQKQTESPTALAVIERISRDRKRCIIQGPGRLEVPMPTWPGIDAVRPGATVRINAQTGGIISVVDYDHAAGNTMRVRSVLGDGRVTIETPIGLGVASAAGHDIKEGDRVLLDPGGTCVRDVVPMDNEQNKFAFVGETSTTWDDIIGQDDAKLALREAIEGPFLHADVFKRYGKTPMKGILLHGPPGNGKTMFGKAVATSIAEVHGERHAGAFLYVKGPELLDKFIGATEAAIRSLFSSARAHHEKHGYPAVIFIDEADALLGRRPDAGNIHAFSEKTIVPQFLTEMDGLHQNAALVMLATNRPDSLDPAIVRDRRIDRKVHVPRPDRKMAEGILRVGFKGKPIAEEGGMDLLVEFTLDRIFSLTNTLVEVRVEKRPEPHAFTLQHIVSGAMLVGMVDKALSNAIRREIAGKKPEGLCRDDVGEAIKMTVSENRRIDHSEAFAEFVGALREKIESIKKIDGGIVH